MTRDELLQLIDRAQQEEWEELNLAGNDLEELPPEIGKLTQLKTLNLSNTSLSMLPESIGQLSNLQSLSLGNTSLSTLPESIGQLTNLQSLRLRKSSLSILPTEIGKLTNLQSLDLSENSLNTLPAEIVQLTNLQSLELTKNQLRDLPSEISQLTCLKALGIRENQLSQLPSEIGQLTNLQLIDLMDNQLHELSPGLTQLSNLQSIYLSNNLLTHFPPELLQLKNLYSLDLSGNKLSKLPLMIDQLITLQALYLGDNELETFPPCLSQLTSLRILDLSSNRLSQLPPSIGSLVSLEKLFLGNKTEFDRTADGLLTSYITARSRSSNKNRLTRLPSEISQLTNLQFLDLSYDALSSLPESINQLTNLQSLNLYNNSLSSLPESITQLIKLKKLDLRGNPVPIPPEVLGPKELDKDPGDLKAILNFYFQVQDPAETEPLYEAKLLIVGEGGAGKTSLAKKLEDEDYDLDSKEKSTEGIEVIRWGFLLPNGQEFRVNIWDFGGQEIYHATHQFFLTKRSLYALVADDRQENTDFYYWLNVVELLSDNSPVIIIKNEKQDRQCPINERQLRGEFNNLEKTLATNLQTRRGLDEIKDALQLYLSRLPHIGTPLPKIWVRVRSALENYAQHCNYISDEKYFELCRQNGFTDRPNMLQLSHYLHDLGVCLHFQEDDLLKKTIILKPEWGTTAVYKVLDTKKVKDNYGRFTRDDLTEIWSDAEYAEMCGELLKLMMRFKLCYEIRNQPNHYISPQLLNIEQPSYGWDERDNLILRYKYDFMPKGILTRLIVEMHQSIEQQILVWKTGVVLSNNRARAEVIEFYHKGEIIVRVSGSDKKGWLSIIDHEFNKIHASYDQLKYDKLVPCNCNTCKGTQEPHPYPMETLLQFWQDRKPIQCQKSYEMVDVRKLIDDALDFETAIQEQQRKEEQHEYGTIAIGTVEKLVIQQGENQPMTDITNNNQGANIANQVGQANDNAQVTASNFSQTSGVSTAELLQLIAAMRQTAAQLPLEIQEDIIIDIDDVEEQIKKPENQRSLPRLKKRLLALAAVGTTIAAQISGATDFAGKAVDLGSKAVDLGNKLGIELQLPPAP